MSEAPSPSTRPDDLVLQAHLNLVEFDREQARWGDPHHVVERDGVLLFAPNTDFPFLMNGVHRLDPTISPEQVLAVAEAFFAEQGRTFTVRPADHEADLNQACAAGAYDNFGDAPEMVCRTRLDPVEVPDDVELTWADDADDIAAFAALGGRAYATYGMPVAVFAELINRPLRLLAPHMGIALARVGGDVVAAALYLLTHEVAGIYWVATDPDHRGRGLGELVTRTVTNTSFDRGARAVTLQASPMGEPVYTRMGYEELYRYTSWMWKPGP